ncbi:DUF2147 domain-containing protein [soil metagenome]
MKLAFKFLPLFLVALLALPSAFAQALPADAQRVLGEWRTIDDATNETKSIVEIYQQNGQVFGRIVRLLPTAENPRAICLDCAPDFNNSDLRGTVILRDLQWNASRGEFSGGRITDPKNGRTYSATVRLENPNRLRVRGFMGVRALGRTQVWERNN